MTYAAERLNGALANRWSKKVPERPRLSIREAVAEWGDDWVWFGPEEFGLIQVREDQDRHSEALTMKCLEIGTIPRIREGDIE